MIHPNVHREWSEWSEEQTLYVAVAYSNPFRWSTRRQLMNNIRLKLASQPNVVLYVGELAYGDRPFEVTDSEEPRHIQLRTRHELFHKENILNRVIQAFPPDWKYGAWIDADLEITRYDWALEAIHQLQHYDFVQLFSSYTDLSGPLYGMANLPTRVNTSFIFNYVQRGFQIPDGYRDGGWKKGSQGVYYEGVVPERRWVGVGATGGAWAFRRSAFETVGGLLDQCILGHADWFMTFGLVCKEAPDMHVPSYHPDYRSAIFQWQKSAVKLKANVGYVDAYAIHHWHGSKVHRAYVQRDLILVKHQFCPVSDLRRDWQGIYQLTDDKPGLRDDIRAYFISRQEDDPNLYPPEKLMV